ncbi:DUF1127 domain-containing protein [Rhizobium wenxiniae]|uniref:DUF1127 domain-containing protein n=1 Tax=Rhizobium wenxiniae TaxID=1737357 RepID=UPI001C6DEECD|nr:DUF1127 domain-containing protein [Rhizobium wenxiniae]
MFWLTKMIRLVWLVWPDRRHQRSVLRQMGDTQLRDLGISRSEAMREGRRPFWQ